jgi:hypothetical protein
VVIDRYWGLLGVAVWFGGILAYVFVPWLHADLNRTSLFLFGWGLARPCPWQ